MSGWKSVDVDVMDTRSMMQELWDLEGKLEMESIEALSMGVH